MRIGTSDSSIPIYPAILNMASYSFSTLSNSACDAELGKRMRLITNIFRPRLARAKLNSDSLIIFAFLAVASHSQLDAFSGNSIKRHRHNETQESRTNLNMEPVVVHW